MFCRPSARSKTRPAVPSARLGAPAILFLGLIASLAEILIPSSLAQALRIQNPAHQKGYELSRKYCAACHLWPSPNLLDAATWKNGVLPLMRSRLGIQRLNPVDPGEKQVLDEWELIWNYYLDAAPEKAPPQTNRPPIHDQLKRFRVENPQYRPGQRYLSLVQIDSKARQIYASNTESKTLDVLSSSGALLSSLSIESPASSLVQGHLGWYCALIGKIPPHDQKLGKVLLLEKSRQQFEKKSELLSNLPRPTHALPLDLNGDSREDIVVSGFGNINGAYSWFERLPSGAFTEHVLLERPGAIRSHSHDFDGDGRPDLAVLLAQAKEGVSLFLNDGGGKFTELPVLEQHPVWGYASARWIDFDGDGALDLLTANGDNGEYDSCFKNYHGLRLYLNRGQNGFPEAWFFPMHGAFQVAAEDFDLDGDVDIAAIAYFPDYATQPGGGFVYLENKGNLQFEASTFPEAQLGRWLVLDSGDVDGDGDADIVLGAANRTPYKTPPGLFERWQKSGPTLLILRNQTKP